MATDPRPTVSVILPVRNGEAYLADALESVRTQTEAPLEILVIDGHSTDRSASLAAAVEGVRVLPQVGTGLATAWNQAVAAAHGDLIAFIAHDDRWTPDKLARQIDYLIAHPATSLLFTWFRFFLRAGCSPPPGFRHALLDQVQTGRIIETMVARRTVFDVVGPFNDYPVAMDMDWLSRTLDHGIQTEILPEVTLHKGVHGGNNSNRIDDNNADLLTLLRESVSRKHGRQALA
jgi:glycosyltransferase involved in cell wall biosynthesis